MPLICGIDPGLTRCGFSILEHRGNKIKEVVNCGIIATSKEDPTSKRLLVLYREIKELLIEYSPELVCVEKVFHKRNVSTATGVTQAQGVILMASEELGIKQLEFTPTEIKNKVTGWGSAGKEEVNNMVQKLCKIDTSEMLPDVTDAIACAISGIFQLRQVSNV
jgi:crossover junction endodeoxyribonuclease RuvC